MASDIDRRLDELAEAVVLADGADMRVLGDMHTHFEALELWAREAGYGTSAGACVAAQELINGLVLGDVHDKAEALDVLSRTVSALQHVSATCSECGVDFPAGRCAAPEAQAAEAVQSAAPAKEAAAPWQGDASLVGDFIQEANEHLEAADMHLLTLETDPGNADALNAVFRAFHTIKGVAGFLALDTILELAHESETLLDKARNGVVQLTGPNIDVSFEAVDSMKRLVEDLADAVRSGMAPAPDPELPGLLNRIRDLVSAAAEGRAPSTEQKPATPRSAAADDVNEDNQGGEEHHHRLGEILVESGVVDAKDVAQALRKQRSEAGGTGTQIKEALRVDADRLDRLVDLIGELVIAETVVIRAPELQEAITGRVARHVSQLDKITRELQEIATSLRMVSLKSTFQKMARLARDVAKKNGKRVDFVTFGEDAELDKSVVDRIGDPLVHMVRNAVDHGLETTEEDRIKAGKPPVGRVELRAYHKGSNVYIEIKDDGRGIDRDAVFAKAVERGLVSPNARLSDREVFNLLFEPGFSTAKKITDVSGRGVGMDVAKKNIEAIRGQIDTVSKPGEGTTFTIRLPLTLAIIDGMVVRVGQERYILPTLSIIRAVRPEEKQHVTVVGKGEMLSLRGQLLPLLRMDHLLEVRCDSTIPEEGIAIVVDDDGRQAALLVDELLGQQQIVIKSLGKEFQHLPGISGGAILPDGNAGLIIDVGGLLTAHRGATDALAEAVREEEGVLAQ